MDQFPYMVINGWIKLYMERFPYMVIYGWINHYLYNLQVAWLTYLKISGFSGQNLNCR
jgi:hypothetical protein